MDISRVADIGTVNQITMTKSAEHRTQTKTSTLATEHTDSFIKSESTFSPAYTKKSAKKQNSDNNLLQREDSEESAEKIKIDENGQQASVSERMTMGISHIIRAMFVKQSEVLTGNVPSVGAKMYAEELLNQLRTLYGNSAAEENTAEYWQPDETAARMLMFFDCVETGDIDNRSLMMERSFISAFNDTEQLFGGRGQLPLESYETKQMVMEAYFAHSR